ncbi:hypothetical protein GGR72_001818 [Xanthomonas arboricola]|nr:hypothetical protein [Xanthomonas arboricola]
MSQVKERSMQLTSGEDEIERLTPANDSKTVVLHHT